MRQLFIIIIATIIIASVCVGQNIPEYFGVYVVANGKLIEIKENIINLKTPSKGGMKEECLAGISELSKIDINDPSSYIILFIENLDINSIKLTKLRYAKTEFLSSTPIVGDTERIRTDINMWVLERDIPFRKGPIEGKNWMYKIVPSDGFEPGVYAINQGGIRNFYVSGGYLGLQLERTESGNRAYDFSFKIAEYKGGAEPEQGLNPSETISKKDALSEMPASLKTSSELIYSLEQVNKNIVASRNANIRNEVQKQAEYFHQAWSQLKTISISKYDVDPSIFQKVKDAFELLNAARDVYISGRAPIKGSVKEKETIEIIKEVIKALGS